MTTIWFINMLFGHLFGDYIFQNNWMAQNKKSDSCPCLVHCSIYTVIIMLFMFPYIPLVFTFDGIVDYLTISMLVFMSHWILDATHLVSRWMKFYGTRSFDDVLTEGKHLHAPCTVANAISITFGAIVYVILDNTIHLFLMWCIFFLLL